MKKETKRVRATRKFTDLIGVDFSTTATKVVRLKQSKSEITLVGADLLPAVDFGSASQRIELPRNMVTNYACLAYSGAAAVVRMIKEPLPSAEGMLPAAKLSELLNVDANFRVSAALVKRGVGRQDSHFIAAAIPENDARFLLNIFSSGSPAPASVEVAGLSFISAFINARGKECANEVVCVIETGESVSHFAFISKGELVLVGKFNFGGGMLREKVVKDLGVDDELAGTILRDPSINVSSTITDVITPFLKQLSISKDFIERHQGCRVSKVYVSGGLSLLPHWSSVLESMINAKVVHWNPFENIQYDSDVLPEELAKQSTRFSAAVGAAIGGFEAS